MRHRQHCPAVPPNNEALCTCTSPSGHVHTWVQHPPETAGGTTVSTCRCGLYAIETTTPTLGKHVYYDDADNLAAMLRAFRASTAGTAPND